MIGRLIAYWRSRTFDLWGPFEANFTIGKQGPAVHIRLDRKRRRS